MANLSSIFGNTAFKPDEVEHVNTDFTPLPPGNYQAMITESEIKPTKAGNGTMLTLKVVVTSGKYSKRVIFENLCVQHSSEKAQAIAQSKLKQICDAVGVKALKDTTQLHDKNFLMSVDIEVDKYQTEQTGVTTHRNLIRSYAKADGKVLEMAIPEGDFSDDIPF